MLCRGVPESSPPIWIFNDWKLKTRFGTSNVVRVALLDIFGGFTLHPKGVPGSPLSCWVIGAEEGIIGFVFLRHLEVWVPQLGSYRVVKKNNDLSHLTHILALVEFGGGGDETLHVKKSTSDHLTSIANVHSFNI